MASEWLVTFTITNINTSGNSPSATVYFGEHPNATDGYDPHYDFLVFSGGMNTQPIVMFFPKTDWGSNNGNYQRDTRSPAITAKTWNTRITRNSTVSTSYLMEWVLPPSLPAYLKLEMVLGTTTIDLRNQSSYSFVYTTPSTPQNFVLRTTLITGLPYITSSITEQNFSDNLMRSISLNNHFGIINGSISYSLQSNPNVVQNISTVGGLTTWNFRPIHGFVGSTSVEIHASGTAGTCTQTVQIHRDNTNSPPQISFEPELVQTLQNHPIQLDFASAFFDIDLDPIFVTAISGNKANALWDNENEILLISPLPAVKGQDTVYIAISDNVNDPVLIPIAVEILPTQPKRVQNVTIAASNGSIILVWDAVDTDVYELPIADVMYKITVYEIIPSGDIGPIQTVFTNEPQLTLSEIYGKAFFKIVTINE
ncbi:MAG: hypothetical protein U1C33_01465 [Candidatus Cloacimonadaceae bacterium]|nr:hypothetical protein [Candidatus Cloacimonadaceae bacterium]